MKPRPFDPMQWPLLFVLFALAFFAVYDTPVFAEEKTPATGSIPIEMPQRSKPVQFATEILPLLQKNCLACHSAREPEAELNLETPESIRKGGENGPAVVPGKGDKSLLVIHSARREKPFMPPRRNKVGATPFTPEQLGLFQLWINQGATGVVAQVSGPVKWRPVPAGFLPIHATAISPQAQFAACSRADQLFLYHLPTGETDQLTDPALAQAGLEGRSGAAHRDMLFSLAFSPDGARLASGGFRTVKFWRRELPRPQKLLSTLPRGESVTGVDTHPEKSLMALGGSKGSLQVWKIGEALPLWTQEISSDSIRHVHFSPEGGRIATLDARSRVRVYYNPDGTRVSREAHRGARALAWLTGNKLAAANDNGSLTVVDPINPRRPLGELAGFAGITSITAMPGVENRLLAGNSDGKFRLVNLDSGKVEWELEHGAPLTGLRVQPGGRRVLTLGGADARLWDLKEKKTILALKGNPLLAEVTSRVEQDLAFAKAEEAYHKSNVEAHEKQLKTETDEREKAKKAHEAAGKSLGEKEKALVDAQTARKAIDDKLKEIATKSGDTTKKKDQAGKSAAELSKSVEVTKKEASAAIAERDTAVTQKVDLLNQAADLGASARNAGILARDAVATAEQDKDNKDLALQADATQALARRKMADFEEALSRFAPARARVEKAKQQSKEKAAQLARLEGEHKATRELEGKLEKELATLGAEKKKAEDSIKDADKKVNDSNGALDQAKKELPLAKSEVDRTEKMVGQSKVKLEKARKDHEAASSFRPREKRRLALAKAAGMASELAFVDACFSTDGTLVYTLNAGGDLQGWSVDSGNRLHAFENQAMGGRFLHVATPDQLLIAGANAEVALWSTRSVWRLERVIGDIEKGDPFTDRILALDFSADGKLLAAGGGFPSRDGEITVWNVETGTHVLAIRDSHSDTVSALEFSPDSRFLASAGTDRFARLFELKTGKEVRAFEGHTGHVLGISYSRGGRRLATSGADNVVKIWDTLSGEQKKSIGGYNKEVTSIHYLGITNQAVTTSGDHLVRLIKEDGNEVRKLPEAGTFMHSSDVTWDGRLVVAGGDDGILRIWETGTGKLLHKFSPPESPVTQLAGKARPE